MGKSPILKLVERYGNCRSVETAEKRTACFSTVPTSLGKLGKKHAEFPTVPTAPATRDIYLPKERRRKKGSGFAWIIFLKPDMSRAIKSGHFNLLQTTPVSQSLTAMFEPRGGKPTFLTVKLRNCAVMAWTVACALT